MIDIQLVSNDAGDGIGVAFVEMASPDVAGLAISKLDGKTPCDVLSEDHATDLYLPRRLQA